MLRLLVIVISVLVSLPVLCADAKPTLDSTQQDTVEAMQRAQELMNKSDPRQEFATANHKTQQTPVMTHIDYNNLPEVSDENLKNSGLDIQKLLSQGKQVLEQAESSKPENQSLQVYVMVSMSMPESLIMNLWIQAEKIQAPLVIRGFIGNDLKSTQEKILELYGIDKTAYEGKSIDEIKIEADKHKNKQLDIDPTLFQRFEIKKVPAIVVAKGVASPCMEHDCPVPEHYVVYGDTTLEYALKLVGEEKEAWRSELEELADRLVGRL
jgi:type-F conjugative transfer system pilin assembly protein TrbC